jgi:ElaB/YqjD/DUF883 family membrane-anchored ribosome-binding protein
MNTNKTGTPSNDGVGQRLEHVGERIGEIKADVARSLGTRVKTLGALIKEHPFAATGVGLGLGYLAGRLLHR